MLIFFLICYIPISIYTCVRVFQSHLLTLKQKVYNSILNLFFPGIWYYLIHSIIFREITRITREEREALLKKEAGYKMYTARHTHS